MTNILDVFVLYAFKVIIYVCLNFSGLLFLVWIFAIFVQLSDLSSCSSLSAKTTMKWIINNTNRLKWIISPLCRRILNRRYFHRFLKTRVFFWLLFIVSCVLLMFLVKEKSNNLYLTIYIRPDINNFLFCSVLWAFQSQHATISF